MFPVRQWFYDMWWLVCSNMTDENQRKTVKIDNNNHLTFLKKTINAETRVSMSLQDLQYATDSVNLVWRVVCSADGWVNCNQVPKTGNSRRNVRKMLFFSNISTWSHIEGDVLILKHSLMNLQIFHFIERAKMTGRNSLSRN